MCILYYIAHESRSTKREETNAYYIDYIRVSTMKMYNIVLLFNRSVFKHLSQLSRAIIQMYNILFNRWVQVRI